ncbi:MAG: hypothetical protein Tsb0015_03020 [Simkaniaceae bacterium]
MGIPSINSNDAPSFISSSPVFQETQIPLIQHVYDSQIMYQLQWDCEGGLPCRIFRAVSFTYSYVKYQILYLLDAFSYRYEAWKNPLQRLFPNADIERMKQVYWQLGKDKWKEAIDGNCHEYGKWVFDQGLHNGTVEPEFILSIERAFHYIYHHLNTRMNADMYLQIHKLACCHFNGLSNNVLIGQEKVGKFRDLDDSIQWKVSGSYTFTEEAEAELNAMDPRIAILDRQNEVLKYVSMSSEQIYRLVNRYFDEFYVEAAASDDDEGRFTAVARLIQKLERLHPTKDGTGRTDTLVMNKLLVEFGFHPVLLKYPYMSSSLGLEAWKDCLRQGLRNWEAGEILA